jgi:hypothetical protein
MKLLSALLVLMVVATCQIRADWTYTATAQVPGITVNTPSNGGGTVSLTDYGTPQPGGTSIAVQAYETTSAATTPISFNNLKYDLALKITDSATHDSGTLHFTGSLTGTLTATTSTIVDSFTPVTSNSLSLDGHTYTVNISSVTLASPSSPQENVMASVSVTNASPRGVTPFAQVLPLSPSPQTSPPPPTTSTPEPTSLLLGSLGFSCFGAGCWWKRRRLT